MKFPSMAAHEAVILTTTSAVSDDNLIKMKTIPFQWIAIWKCRLQNDSHFVSASMC